MLREPGVWATHGSMADERTPPSWGRLAGLGGAHFLWTTVREPAARLMSESADPCSNLDNQLDLLLTHPGSVSENRFYFHGVGMLHLPQTVQSKLRYLRVRSANYMLGWLAWSNASIRSNGNVSSSQLALVDAVLDRYDLVGTSELFDESMVLLASRLRLPLEDVVYLSSKVRSNCTRGTAHPPLSDEPEEVRSFLASDLFSSRTALDRELWRRATARVVQAVAAPSVGATEVRRFRELLQHAQQACSPIQTACTVGDGYSDCLVAPDVACEHSCMLRFKERQRSTRCYRPPVR